MSYLAFLVTTALPGELDKQAGWWRFGSFHLKIQTLHDQPHNEGVRQWKCQVAITRLLPCGRWVQIIRLSTKGDIIMLRRVWFQDGSCGCEVNGSVWMNEKRLFLLQERKSVTLPHLIITSRRSVYPLAKNREKKRARRNRGTISLAVETCNSQVKKKYPFLIVLNCHF